MTTALTPPPVPPASATPPAPQPPRAPSAAGRVIAILAIALGAVVVLGTVFSAVSSTVASALVRTETRTMSVDAETGLDVDLSAGSLTIVFVEGQRDAQLEVTGPQGASDWTFETEGDAIKVASPNRPFLGPGWIFGGAGRAVLKLPGDMQDAAGSADIDVSAGDFALSGALGDVHLELGAGRATLSGSARNVTAEISAGSADLDLSSVATASFTVSAGAMDVRLTGTQPSSITADVSAGSLDMRVPQGQYDIRSSVSAGDFDSRIDTQPGASSTVTVQVSAGSATLRED